MAILKQSFLSAIQFLSIIPVGRHAQRLNADILIHFPLVGLLIGMLVAGWDYCLGFFCPDLLRSLLDVLLFAIITGALHLDGVADTADGLFSHRSIDQKLTIMRDSRTGAMGLIAIFFVLSLKWSSILSIPSELRPWILILAPSLARYSVLLGMKFLPYGRPEGGIASVFYCRSISQKCLMTILLPLIISVFMGWYCIWLWISFCGWVIWILLLYHWHVKCITGDMMGAMIELVETGLFISFTLL